MLLNKRQKIVQEAFLNNEEAVIRRLKSVYGQSLKDITKKSEELQNSIISLTMATMNADMDEEAKKQLQSMIQSKVYQKQYQDALKKQVGSILDNMQVEEFKTVSEYLNKCYEEGFLGTMYDLQGQGIPLCFPLDQEAMVRAVQLDSKISNGLYSRLGEDVALLKKKITAQVSRGIATGMTFQQVAKGLSDYTNIGFNNAVRIARTEGHRIQVQSGMDACYKAKEKGADVVKQWDSTLDGKTRPSHRQVDGEIRELDEPFSNKLMFPGDPSGSAAEVVNCRCALLQRARWALDEAELETLKKRAEYFGLDKNDSFEDFKKKYLKVADDALPVKPIRPRKADFDDDDEYYSAREKYKIAKDAYEQRLDEIVQKNMKRPQVFKTKEEVLSWVKETGITIDDDFFKNIDLRVFDDTKDVLEEMFEKYPFLKEFKFDGNMEKSIFRLDVDTDFGCLMSANGGLRFNNNAFSSYEYGLRTSLEQMAEGFNVHGDGTFKTLLRHEVGHNVESYIKLTKCRDVYDETGRKLLERGAAKSVKMDNELRQLANLKGVSEYALTNTAELFAEGFAEYTSGGTSEFGKAFGEFLERWLNK